MRQPEFGVIGIPEELPDAVRTPAEARRWVAEDYRTKGYAVIAEPGSEDLPEELCAFHWEWERAYRSTQSGTLAT